MSQEDGLWPLTQRLDAALFRQGSDSGLWERVHDAFEELVKIVFRNVSFETSEALMTRIFKAQDHPLEFPIAQAGVKLVRFLVKILSLGLQMRNMTDKVAYEKQKSWYERIRKVAIGKKNDIRIYEIDDPKIVECMEAFANLEMKYGMFSLMLFCSI